MLAGFLVTAGFTLMAFDSAPYGFGIPTLWVAPPLLLAGFLFPVFGIVNRPGSLISGAFKDRSKHLVGISVFLTALIVYVITLEPTASLWDCSEFIASAYKLQVPHTPGTPLSLLIGRLFTMFSFGDETEVAWTLNFMSAFFSASTVFLLYHVIYHLGSKLISESRFREVILIISSSGGSLCLAFSDTFWFSAVEAETYGLACFFLMLLAWLILSGRNLKDHFKTKRLILISYLAGLSYCIHPMCLLAIPMLPFAWGTVNKKVSLLNSTLLIAGGLAIVLLINRFVALGAFELAFGFDKMFVNGLRLPFYSGAIAFVLVIISLLWTALRRWTHVTRYLWSVAFLLLGFIPYLLLFIRSNHNPPIDEFNPENLPLIKAYMNRESYPSSPLLYGPYFDAKIVDLDIKKKIYFKDDEKYSVAGTLPAYVYDSRKTILPRMYSNDADHIAAYREWTEMRAIDKPDFSDNLRFMFTYQLGHMYFRYLIWNFAGRAGDTQDSKWLPPWERSSSTTFEKARNQYWMIPLFLGIAGAAFHCRRDRKSFISVFILFLITGLILAVYLNAPPNAPRERDYIYVGSFISFCIWIGLGFMVVGSQLAKFRGGISFTCVVCLAVPLWMLYENIDDHDRSGRTFQVDNAKNILRSCAPNSILFTGGDNDTFPLWYVQDVEGFRTDVRVMVTSYMNSDWYINQLRKDYYDSGAFNLTLDEKDYRQYGANDVLYVHESIQKGIDVAQFIGLLKKEHPALKMLDRNGEPYHILPSRTLVISEQQRLPVSETSLRSETPQRHEMRLHISDNYLHKNLLAILDLIVSNGWDRPIYFNFSSLNTLGVDLSSYVIQEGPVFRLRPEKNLEGIAVDTGLSYRNIVELADYSNLNDPDVYFSYEDHFARMIVPVRHSFNELANAFLMAGDHDKALAVMDDAIARLYPGHLPPSYTNLEAAEILYTINETEKADHLCREAFEYYFTSVESDMTAGRDPERLHTYLVQQAALMMERSGQPDYQQKVNELRLQQRRSF